jgi:hypothetical protein
MADNYFEVTGPRPRFLESEGRVVEVREAENAARTGVTREAPFEGIGQAYGGAFVDAIHSTYSGYGDSRYAPSERVNPSPMAPAPRVPERDRQTYDVTIAGQANGRSLLGAGKAVPAWNGIDNATLTGFAYGTAPTDATGASEWPGNTVQAQVAPQNGGRRRNEAEIRRAP